MKNKGFTLMELMLTVGILGMITVTVTAMFFRAFRGSSKTDTVVTLDQNAQLSLSLMERFVRNGKGVTVNGGECPASGDSLEIANWDGGETIFNLSNGQIASNGAVVNEEIVVVSNLNFSCVRIEGIPDQITITFDAQRSDAGGGAETTASYKSVVSLRNY